MKAFFHPPSQQVQAYRYALSAVALWSTVATAFKISLRSLSPIQLLAISSVVSVLTLFVILLLQGKKHLIWVQHHWQKSCLQGFLNPFMYYLILFQAYEILPAQEAQALNYTWALTLAFLSVPLLKQKLSQYDILGGCIAYGGVMVIATRGQILTIKFEEPWGVALALMSTLIWALYWILNTRDTRDPVVALFWNFVWALPFIVVYLIWNAEGLDFPAQGLWGAVYVGFFEMGLAFVFWLKAMKLTNSTAKIANLIFLSPFLSLIFLSYIAQEPLLPSTLPALCLILLGIWIQSKSAQLVLAADETHGKG